MYPLVEDAERVRRLLANAPADTAWHRREYLVLCQAHPDTLQLGKESTSGHGGVASGSPGGTEVATTEAGSLNKVAGRSKVVLAERGLGAAGYK